MAGDNLTKRFHIHGLNIKLTTPHRRVAERYSRSFPHFETDELQDDGPTLEYHVGDFDPPDGLESVAPDRYGRHRTLLWHPFPKAKLLVRDLTQDTCVVKQSRLHQLLFSEVFQPVLRMLWALQGKTYQHCASVSKGEKGVLLPGFGNIGKTTLTYKLFKRGFDYMGDDETVFAPSGDIFAFPNEIGLYHTTITQNGIQLSRRKMWESRAKYLVSKLPQKWIYTSVKVHPWEIQNPDVNPSVVTESTAEHLFLLERGDDQLQPVDVDEVIRKTTSSTLYKEHEAVRGLLYAYASVDPAFDPVDLHQGEKEVLRLALADVSCHRLTFRSFDFAVESIADTIDA